MKTFLRISIIFAGTFFYGCKVPAAKISSASPSNPGVGSSSSSSNVATISGPLTVSSAVATLTAKQSLQINARGGVPPYSYSVQGMGSITSSGVFSASLPGQSSILISDSSHQKTSVTVMIKNPAPLSPGNFNSSQQWDLQRINGPGAWALNSDCSSVVIAVTDTGIDFSHPDLAANIWTNPNPGKTAGMTGDLHGWNFVSNNNNPQDDHYHGTHVSGTIGAVGNAGLGITGVCWKASILPLKTMDSTGSGTSSDAIKAFYYAVDVGAKVINASWGSGSADPAMQQAVQYASDSGVLVIAAAGNGDCSTSDSGPGANNDRTPCYPANYSSPNVISVAATDQNDALTSWSNFGAASVHLAAPGTSIYSTFPSTVTAGMSTDGYKNANYMSLDGTSMATPHVAAAAALVWAMEPGLKSQDVKALLLKKVDLLPSLNGKTVSGGRLNLYNLFQP